MAQPQSLHNGTGSASPTVMDSWNTTPRYRFGVIVSKYDGSVRIFRQDTSQPPDGAAEDCVTNPTGTGVSYIYFAIANGSARGNDLGLPIQGGGYDTGVATAYDDHYAFAIGCDNLNQLWVVGNMHSDAPFQAIRSADASGDWDATWRNAWAKVTYFAGSSTTATLGNLAHTYNYFNRTSNGTLLWFMEQQDSDDATRGRDQLLFIKDTTTNWKKYGTVAGDGALDAEMFQTTATGTVLAADQVTDPPPGWETGDVGTANTVGRQADRVYVCGTDLYFDAAGAEWLGVVGIWRTGDKYGNTQQQPFYVKVKVSDLLARNATATAWKTVDGHTQQMPVTWANRNTAGGTSSPARFGWNARKRGATITSCGYISRGFGFTLAHDDNGYPHVIMGNGGTWQAGETNGTLGERMGMHPSYNSGVSPPKVLRHYWDGNDWQVASATLGSAGLTQPSLFNHRGTLVMVGNQAQRTRVSTNIGMPGATLGQAYVGGPVLNGFEIQAWHPTYMKNEPIALPVHDYDTPRIYEYGGHAQANGVPDKPRAPTASVAGLAAGEALVSWSAPLQDGGPNILGYIVTPLTGTLGADPWPYGMTAGTPQTFTGTGLSATLTGLTAGAKRFSVRAYTVSGKGIESAATNTVTVT